VKEWEEKKQTECTYKKGRCLMDKNYLRMFFAVTTAVVFIAGSALAVEMVGMHQLTGTIGMVNTTEGIMQLRLDLPQGKEEMKEFRINQDETRVTDNEDNDLLVVKDLKAGQHVTVQVADGNEDMIVKKIIIDYNSDTRSVADSSDGNESYIVRGDNAGIVGPRGLTGPAGSIGEKGYTGANGPAGVSLSGPRGETGPAGPKGEQGFTGPRGYRGITERGAMGETGVAGPQGVRGSTGATGEQGASSAGYAGPIGAAGPRGEQGPMGNRGDVGPTLVGPTGPAGYAGSTGDQGVVGAQGTQGSTTAGGAGEIGPSGVMGEIGPKGETGEQGSTGMVNSWTTYREFNFDSQNDDIRPADMLKVSDIAAYVKQNPSLQIEIDDTGSGKARSNSVRTALIQAGVPSDKIQIGTFRDRKNRHNGGVEVLFKTAK